MRVLTKLRSNGTIRVIILILGTTNRRILNLRLRPITITILYARLSNDKANRNAIITKRKRTTLMNNLLVLEGDRSLKISRISRLMLVVLKSLLKNVNNIPRRRRTTRRTRLETYRARTINNSRHLPRIVRRNNGTIIGINRKTTSLIRSKITLFCSVTSDRDNASGVCYIMSSVPIQIRVSRGNNLTKRFFLLMRNRHFPSRIPRATIITTLSNRFVTMRVISLFGTTKNKTRRPRKRIKLFNHLPTRRDHGTNKDPNRLTLL